MLVVGDREAADGTISVRTRTGGDQGASTVSEFVAAAQTEIAAKGKAQPSDVKARVSRFTAEASPLEATER
jgi:threonyl-tRNA synthetase